MDSRDASAHGALCRVFSLFVVPVMCGCADVRVVREAPNGGVLALPMNNNCWPMYYRDRAEKLMRAKCPNGYRIEREEFVWNGKEGVQGHRYRQSFFGYTDPNDEFAPYLRKEYRITFSAAAAHDSGKPSNDKPAVLPQPSSISDKGKEELPPPRPLKDVK